MPASRTLRHISGVRSLATSLLVLALLSGCSDSLPSLPKVTELNPFKEKQAPLPGKRIPVMPSENKVGELADGSSPIILPPPMRNEEWSQPGGIASNAPGHLELTGAVKQTWSVSAGAGSSKAGRVMARPIVYDNRIYTLDAEGTVAAFSLSGGSALWRATLAPNVAAKGGGVGSILSTNIFTLGAADGGGYGGGLAAEGGRVFAASGYGTVIALDPASGKRIWEKTLGVPIRQSPTASGDRVFVITAEGRLHCFAGTDGAELWAVRGLPQQASLGLNASPAVEDDVVAVPYASGDLVALRASDGTALWSESLSRTRTTSQLASMSDAARPAIDNGTVFAVGHGGRMVATVATTGERIWSVNVPSTQTPWVAGETIYVMDTQGQLRAINRRDGRLQWSANMPGATTWSGPTLAGGTLWLASNKGQLIGVDPLTGRVTGQLDIGDPVFIAPIVAQGRMFIFTDEGRLIAYN